MGFGTMLPLLAFSGRPYPGRDSAQPADIEMLAATTIAWDTKDKSGLTGTMGEDRIPADRLGSFGSGIAYTGSGNTFVALSDRGPKDGAVDFVSRFHTLSIEVRARTAGDSGVAASLSVTLLATTLFKDADGATYTGLSRAFDAEHPVTERRFDPEAIAVSPAGTIFTSDEYGPWIDEWTSAGVHLRRIPLPQKFQAQKRADDPRDELPPNNASGREANRGLEGMCFSTDGTRLLAILQSPLIQDGALNHHGDRVGTNVRMIECRLADGSFREFVYTLDDPAFGINELVAIGPHAYLSLEKDGKEGKKAKARRIYRIDLEGATDVSSTKSLPGTAVPEDVQPVKKRLLFDMLEARFGLAGADMPEKIEGLAFGPDLGDGRHVLFVASDNDFREGQATRLWAFAVSPALLAGFERPKLREWNP